MLQHGPPPRHLQSRNPRGGIDVGSGSRGSFEMVDEDSKKMKGRSLISFAQQYGKTAGLVCCVLLLILLWGRGRAPSVGPKPTASRGGRRTGAVHTEGANASVTGTTAAKASALYGATPEGAVRRRVKAALMGALVADAATMGLHWFYQLGKLHNLLKSKGRTDKPEFFEPPSCPDYKYDSGQFSPYGEEMMSVLIFMDGFKKMHGEGYAQYLAVYFGESTGYLMHTAMGMKDAIAAGKKYPECGDPQDKQADGVIKAIAVAALYAGRPALRQAVELAVRGQQNNDQAVAFATANALILQDVILGTHGLEGALRHAAFGEDSQLPITVKDPLRDVLRRREANLRNLLFDPKADYVAGLWGNSCECPGALQGALLAALQANGSYVQGVRSNIKLGGDNCSRAMVLGALLAAEGGLEAIPKEWQDKTTRYKEVEQIVDRLMEFRDTLAV